LKKIVIISNYFPPEMGAAANRIKNLADCFINDGNLVEIICPLPNYPKGKIFKKYKYKFNLEETIDKITVKRYWIYPSISKNLLKRFFSMFSFSLSMWFSFFSLYKNKPNLIIIQSPPLLVALSGLLLSKLLKVDNVLNVSDLWPLSAYEIGVLKKGRTYKVLEKIENINYKLADKIIGQSNEIISHIKRKIDKEGIVYRNVPKLKIYNLKESKNKKLTIVYAGLLGFAQDILEICKNIDFKKLDVEFHIYGIGSQESKIAEYANNVENIFFHGSRNSNEIKEEILKYDIGLVPLKNRIFGAVPSKIFELMQLGVPILFVGSGEGERIIKNSKCGLSSKPNDYEDLSLNISIFKKMKSEDYVTYSKNCINAHSTKYNLEYQLKNLKSYLNLKE